jgi:hypothetical protein
MLLYLLLADNVNTAWFGVECGTGSLLEYLIDTDIVHGGTLEVALSAHQVSGA